MTLSDQLTVLPGVGESFAKKLANLNLFTISDLLNHFPRKYLDLSHPTPISQLTDQSIDSYVCLKACLVKFNNFRYKSPRRGGGFLQTAVIADDQGKLPVIWFNMPYLDQSLKVGEWYYFNGQVKLTKGKLTLVSPDFEPIKDQQLHSNRIIPIYPETAGVSSKWLRSKMFLLLNSLNLPEILPPTMVDTYSLFSHQLAYQQIHFPENLANLKSAESRLSFNDLLSIYLKSALTKKAWADHQAHAIPANQKLFQRFTKSLPFQLTPDQSQVISQITSDLSQLLPMNRLLQGDVGSGKTIVAAAAALQTINAGHQVIIMAPTQVLAGQHFDSLSKIFVPFGITPTLVTSSTSRNLKLLTPDCQLLVGTHALLHLPAPANLGLLVVDEQHRFGVLQRSHFLKGQLLPHVLTMTATPIPRTIALSFYGHLDISYLKTMPDGRKQVKTWVTPESKRPKAYDWIKQELQNGNQAFVVCPFIDQSQSETLKNVKAAQAEFLRLQQVFADFRVGLLHGKMKNDQKQTVLTDFRLKKLDVLVTTPVIEVGVDIPNANIMVIEGAERFGLSSLHQLRGRVGRGEQQAYCLLFPSSPSNRLKLLEKHHDGLVLAKFDLKMRGAGDLFGTAQSGYLDTRFKSFWDKDLRSCARQAASSLVSTQPQAADKLLQLLTPKVAKIDTSN